MKKNISINIGGIIFHIEEDGYDRLKNYLESINKYFATFEDSKEIIEDIESRIAEIFLSKLTEGNQVVTGEDVNALMSTMGSISDFEAVEEQESFVQQPKISDTSSSEKAQNDQKTHTKESKASKEPFTGQKKLYRDNKRKLVGGVAAGIANYFNMDPLWVRLIIIILVFNLVLWEPIGGLVILAYIVMWIILPTSNTLAEDKNMKKMFRSSEHRVLGGVAGGLAAFFGTDITLIRILFIITAFFGAGLILYIALWIITPEAKSITDRIQMQGEPVTLSNIESSVKESLNVDKDAEENLLTKIILFPFRLIALILNGLRKALGPILLFIVELVRIIAGFIILITGVALIIGFTISLSAILGVLAGGDFLQINGEIPIDLIKATIPSYVIIAGFVALVIPALALAATGGSLIAKRKTLNATAGWTLFGIWILSLFALGTTVPGIVRDFWEYGEYQETQIFEVKDKTAYLDIRDTGIDGYEGVRLRIRANDENEFRLVKTFESQGRNRQDAIENAQMIDYKVAQNDSIILFDRNITYRENSEFRAQRLTMTLYVPYDKTFVMDQDMSDIIHNTLGRNGYSRYDIRGNTWMFSTSDGLICITCDNQDRTDYRGRSYNKEVKEYDNIDFDKIIIGENFEVEIRQGNEYSLSIEGRERDIYEVEITQDDNVLDIDIGDNRYGSDDLANLEVVITMPNIKSAYLAGGSRTVINGFDEDEFDLTIVGTAKANVDMDANNANINLEGSATLHLEGRVDQLKVNARNKATFNGYDCSALNVIVDATDASDVKVYASETLEIIASGNSAVQYKGDAVVNQNESGNSNIIKE